MLGRMQAVQIAVVTGGPADLGDLEHGAVASISTPEIAVVSGGLACVLGVFVLGRLLPRFVNVELDHRNRPTPAESGAGESSGAPRPEEVP